MVFGLSQRNSPNLNTSRGCPLCHRSSRPKYISMAPLFRSWYCNSWSVIIPPCMQKLLTPLFYHTVHITFTQFHRVISTSLHQDRCLATYVRHLLFAGIWAEGGKLIAASTGVNNRDIRNLVLRISARVSSTLPIPFVQSTTHRCIPTANSVYPDGST